MKALKTITRTPQERLDEANEKLFLAWHIALVLEDYLAESHEDRGMRAGMLVGKMSQLLNEVHSFTADLNLRTGMPS